ncbi:hypothetical protein KC950_02955 [Candidatus Saccharibacteria bacterium]|nr:hypothetical protein [Candidatus Saccharibacteria bacterium]
MSVQSKSQNIIGQILYSILYLVLALILSAVLLFAFSGLAHQSRVYTNNLDAAAKEYIFFTVLGYVATYVLVLIVLFYKSKIHPISYSFNSFIVLAFMMFLRGLSADFSHLDCGNNCISSVIPQKFDNQATSICFATLVAIAIIFNVLYLIKYRSASNTFNNQSPQAYAPNNRNS